MNKSRLSFLTLICLGLCFSGCDTDRYDYDEGYEAAWNEENPPSRFATDEYRVGYQQGLMDAAMYDEGYYDGYEKNRPKYPKDPDYMDGYYDRKEES